MLVSYGKTTLAGNQCALAINCIYIERELEFLLHGSVKCSLYLILDGHHVDGVGAIYFVGWLGSFFFVGRFPTLML